jgi:biotin synthase
MNRDELLRWLKTDDPEALAELWRAADTARREHVGNAVYLRGRVKLSNHCLRHCGHCESRKDNLELNRFRLSADEVLGVAHECQRLGYGTIVLQAGEDYALTPVWMSDLIRQIKSETSLAITLSLGQRRPHELREWRLAGADRYFLRFGTIHAPLYKLLYPQLPGESRNRLETLRQLRGLGYEVGSGVMIGIPGQSYELLADDILMCRELDLDVVSVSLYYEEYQDGNATRLARAHEEWALPDDQVLADETTTYKVLALLRLVCPTVNVPCTTALAAFNPAHGREFGLLRGANLVLPDLTPKRYRSSTVLFPNSTCTLDDAQQCEECVKGRILRIGRAVGVGRGDSIHMQQRGQRGNGRNIEASSMSS